MTEPQFHRTNYSKIMSYEAYLRLHEWHYTEAHAGIPIRAIPDIAKSYTVATKHQKFSKMIEKIIWDVCTKKGWNVRKPHDKGRQIFKDGKSIWIKSNYTKAGEADRIVEIPVNGLTLIVNFEVKYDKDTQADHQKDMQQLVEKQGQLYFIVKTIDDFWGCIDLIEGKYLKP